jgi:hypothetical protein
LQNCKIKTWILKVPLLLTAGKLKQAVCRTPELLWQLWVSCLAPDWTLSDILPYKDWAYSTQVFQGEGRQCHRTAKCLQLNTVLCSLITVFYCRKMAQILLTFMDKLCVSSSKLNLCSNRNHPLARRDNVLDFEWRFLPNSLGYASGICLQPSLKISNIVTPARVWFL